MSETSEAFTDLMARACQGDNGAMMELVRQYEPEIRRVAHNRIGPALRPYLDSLDLVQSVHRSLILNLRKQKFTLSKQEELIALAVTFLVRKVSHQWRKIQREEQILRLVEILRRRVAVTEDPTAALERRDRVRNLLEQTGDDDRRLLELHLEERSTEEIAKQLHLKENVVRARRSKLFRKLRAAGADPLGAE
jgi:RNA polymerase sigma-70 factor (ECF subfamily)